ncbi:uncharacterized protein EI90DRAFT_297356 [Cantharellus anzutake]|uniref:uncharacterized protein n=1 Tax=Cantharellus anzutake TaxID=1750568 RepID=UPI0019033128|nr:uncharacterized protein EI90DRAFT_297356 [Cantharellus anzutake]KAF8315991.1 hypothetical protein EI90DRAFT_297356 [Cantharellus anzutake]
MILTTLTLYWFTQTYARSIHAYRELFPGGASTPTLPTDDPSLYIHKPFGYSYFPHEVIPVPACWVATTGKLSFVRYHETGGHFAAQLSPAEFANDLIEFFGPMKNTLATVPPSPAASNASFDRDTHLMTELTKNGSARLLAPSIRFDCSKFPDKFPSFFFSTHIISLGHR